MGACISRRPIWWRISIARSKRRRRRACCARYFPTPAFRRPRSAAVGAAARRRRRGKPHAVHRAETAGRGLVRLRPRCAMARGPPGRSAFRPGRRGRRPQASLAGTVSTPQRTVFAQRIPEAIDAGVFHNDVVAVGDGATAVLSRARVRRSGRRARRVARAVGDAFAPIIVAQADVIARRRRAELPVQQPAACARRRRAGCSSHRPSARASARERVPRPPGASGGPIAK